MNKDVLSSTLGIAKGYTVCNPNQLEHSSCITIDGKCVHGKWVTGYYVQASKYQDSTISIHAIFTTDCQNIEYARYTCSGWYPIIPESLCWYSGILDKYEVPIYTNSIVKVDGCTYGYGPNKDLAIVAYLQQDCGYALMFPYKDIRLGHRGAGSGYWQDCRLEVVGDIFTHPNIYEEYR